MTMCDRVAVMHEGVLEQVGTPETVYGAPATPFVADFIGTSNLLDGVAQNGHLAVGDATLPVGVDGEGDVTVVIRPEDIRIGDGPVRATIEDVFYAGDTYEVLASIEDGPSLTLELDRQRSVTPGQTVTLGFDDDAVHVVED